MHKRLLFLIDLADTVPFMGLKDTPMSIYCKVTDAIASLDLKLSQKWSIVIFYVPPISYGVHGHFSQGIET